MILHHQVDRGEIWGEGGREGGRDGGREGGQVSDVGGIKNG